ncbi:MAG: arginine--tRNA ligase [bacterium]|nr:arginine--tRNA ligase [bacterium]
MYLQEIKEQLASMLEVVPTDFVYPPAADLGDLSLPLFALAKTRGLSPVELAKELAASLKESPKFIGVVKNVNAVGPYLNFYLDSGNLVSSVISDIEKFGIRYGESDNGHEEIVMVEFSNANTHKEYHIGHLRNLFYGDTISRMLRLNGYQTIPVSYINDFGIHTAKTLWNWRRNPEFAAQDGPKGRLLGECYAQAAKELEGNEEAKVELAAVMKQIEKRKGEMYELWKETREWSISYLDEIYQRLGIKFENIFYESEEIDEGLRMVEEFLQRGVFIRSQGAVIADLDEYGLGVLPIIRSDGTALYPAADLALARRKFQAYDINESIYVVDIRQGLYFKQLGKIFELAGENFNITHLGYDFVTLKNGMMSSRTGNVITYAQIINEAYTRAEKEIITRHEDWDAEKVNKIAEALTVAALKFEMLKISADKVITFDMEEALRFDGFTAAYLQYTGARIASILRKADENIAADYSLLIHPKEHALAMQLSQYQEALVKAGAQRDPSIIARYLFELAQVVNDYYHEVNILKASTDEKIARLGLLRAVKQALANGFRTLGFAYLEEM